MTAEVLPIRPGKKLPAAAPVWLSPEQVCEQVPGLTLDILADRRKKRLRPDFQKPSQKTVVYEQSEVDDWVASTRVTCRRE